MPNIYTENAQRWLDLSEVDYLGTFVKAWLAFNAWYRGAYNGRQDRGILDKFKWEPNTIRNKIVPLLGSESSEARQLRSRIADLHYKLDNFETWLSP